MRELHEPALSLLDETARTAGGIEAGDREGVRRALCCTTRSMGAIHVHRKAFGRPQAVGIVAALAKRSGNRPWMR